MIMSASLPTRKRYRKPRTVAPKQQSLEEYISCDKKYHCERHINYGVVMTYLGCKGRCIVKLVTDTGLLTLNARLKNSYQNPKLGQQLQDRSIVLVDDGTIVLVYRPDHYSVIDRDVFRQLENIMNEGKDSGKDSEKDSGKDSGPAKNTGSDGPETTTYQDDPDENTFGGELELGEFEGEFESAPKANDESGSDVEFEDDSVPVAAPEPQVPIDIDHI